MSWWNALFIAVIAILAGFTQFVAKRAGLTRNAQPLSPQLASRFNGTPYALFLSGMAAIIGCLVAIPTAIINRDWIPMLVPAVFSGAAFLSALWSLKAKGLSYSATNGEFYSLMKRENKQSTE